MWNSLSDCTTALKLPCAVTPKASRALKLGDEWVQSAVLVMRRAKVTKTRMWFSADSVLNCLSNLRFANAPPGGLNRPTSSFLNYYIMLCFLNSSWFLSRQHYANTIHIPYRNMFLYFINRTIFFFFIFIEFIPK